MPTKKKPKKITQHEAIWYRDRAASHRDEIRELRAAIAKFIGDLGTAIPGRLIGDELQQRISEVVRS